MKYQIDPILDVEDISAKSMQAGDQARCIQATPNSSSLVGHGSQTALVDSWLKMK